MMLESSAFRRGEYVKSIASGVFNLVYVLYAVNFLMIAGVVIGLIGAYLTIKRRTSTAYILVLVSVINAGLMLTGYEKVFPCIWGLGYAFASMIDFQLLNLQSDYPDKFLDPDMMNKQIIWLKQVDSFIERLWVYSCCNVLSVIIRVHSLCS